jgi:hypothetical protein
MAKYNLIRNSLVDTPIVSGTGNLELSINQIELLYDNNTTSSGVSLSSSDILFIDIEMPNRIKLDEVSLFFSAAAGNPSASGSISFYYKNYESGDYIELDKDLEGDKFYTINHPDPFAPKYIRMVIEEEQGHLYEAIVYNDDFDILFGKDGNLVDIVLDDMSENTELYLYNNADLGNPSIDAYIMPDPFESGSEYIKIATSIDGEYKGIYDGIGIDNNSQNKYNWSMGEFSHTIEINNSIQLLPSTFSSDNFNDFTKTLVPLVEQPGGTYFNVGENCMDWFSEGIIYAICRPSGTSSLHLYKYTYDDNSWEFIKTLPSSYGVDGYACMTCLGNYVYIIVNFGGSFVRYDVVNGGDWETLVGPEHPIGTYGRQAGMCSDRNRYIYSLTTSRYYDNGKSHKRYDVINNTWESMSTGYVAKGDNATYTYTICITMSYSSEEDVVYMDCGESTYGSGNFQKYYVATNTWDTDWKIDSTNRRDRVISYYKNYFVYCGYNYGNYLYVYNLEDLSLNMFLLPYIVKADRPPNLLCFQTSDGMINVMVTNLNHDLSNEIFIFPIGTDKNYNRHGYYITPIIDIGDTFNSAYLSIDRTTSGGSSISCSDSVSDVIEIKSSNETPRAYDKVLLGRRDNFNNFYIVDCDTVSGDIDDTFDKINITSSSSYNIDRILFDRSNIDLILLVRNGTTSSAFFRYDLIQKRTTHQSSYSNAYRVYNTKVLDVDVLGNVWVYGDDALRKMNYDMSQEFALTKSTSDFISCISASKTTGACWYIDTSSKTVVNINDLQDELCSISFSDPKYITASSSGGCYVYDFATKNVVELSYDGTEVNSFELPQFYIINGMSLTVRDNNDLFLWFIDGYNRVLMYSCDGTLIKEIAAPTIDHILGCGSGCIVSSATFNKTYRIDIYGNITNYFDFSSYQSSSYVGCPIYISYDEMINDGCVDIFKYTNDPVWLDDYWKEMNINKIRLENKKFHQVKLKFNSAPGAETPYLNKIFFPEPTKVTGIYPKTSKPVYLKTEFSNEAEDKEYNTKLRCWWGI